MQDCPSIRQPPMWLQLGAGVSKNLIGLQAAFPDRLHQRRFSSRIFHFNLMTKKLQPQQVREHGVMAATGCHVKHGFSIGWDDFRKIHASCLKQVQALNTPASHSSHNSPSGICLLFQFRHELRQRKQPAQHAGMCILRSDFQKGISPLRSVGGQTSMKNLQARNRRKMCTTTPEPNLRCLSRRCSSLEKSLKAVKMTALHCVHQRRPSTPRSRCVQSVVAFIDRIRVRLIHTEAKWFQMKKSAQNLCSTQTSGSHQRNATEIGRRFKVFCFINQYFLEPRKLSSRHRRKDEVFEIISEPRPIER
eukprot:m.112133 g.112133  ORF g.112133 m.112133 type:complete len:305 (+) comp51837_c0_seq28:1145-2059(+)